MPEVSSRAERNARRRAAGALLRHCLIGEPPADQSVTTRLLARTTDSSLLAMARYHGAGGWLYESVRGLPVASTTLLAGLEEDHRSVVRWHLHGLWQLARIGKTLQTAGARWVAVKGAVLVDTLHGPLGRRPYKDLDVLVHPHDFGVALAALQADGGVLLDRNWPLLRREQRAQVHLAMPSGIEIDLHWDLVNVNRRRMAIDTGVILDRSAVVDLGGFSVPTLDPADSVIHLAVHAAVSGGDKLMWLKDIERSAAIRPPDWEAVVERAIEWRVAGPVGLMLLRALDVLAAEIPADVPTRLLGTRLARFARFVDRLEPLEASPGGPTPARVLARAIGHGVIGGAVVMAHRLIRHFDPREPARSSPFTAVGNTGDRELYLHTVSASGREGSKR